MQWRILILLLLIVGWDGLGLAQDAGLELEASGVPPVPPAAVEPLPPPTPAAVSFVTIAGLADGAEIVGKKPVFTGEFLVPVWPGSYAVILDNTDVTALVVLDGNHFTLQQPVMLNAGPHTLSVYAMDSAGQQVQHNVTFTSRHTASFEEAYGSGELAVVAETPLDKGKQADYPDIKVDGNLRSEMKVRKGNAEFGLRAGLRYFDQSEPLPYSGDPPALEKGVTLLDYLFTGRYGFTDGSFLAEVGNVTINETANTVANLARRGARVALDYQNLSLSSFVVKGENVLGFRDGTGISYDMDDQIAGGSAALRLFDNQVQVRAVYADGGEPLGSYGISQPGANRRGDIFGVNLVTDFFQGRLRTEAEYDRSRYDPDSSDEFDEESDHAWLLRVGGSVDLYTYQVAYEYFGSDYASIGSQMQVRDREAVAAQFGATFGGVHVVALMGAAGHDNVDDDPLLPEIEDYQGQIDYSYNGLPQWPMGLGYQFSVRETDSLPEGQLPFKQRTDAVTGRIGYAAGQVNVSLSGSYSYLDDQEDTDNDSSAIAVSLSPAWMSEQVSITPNFSWNRSKEHTFDTWTDTYVTNLDIRSNFLQGLLTFDVACSYTVTTDSEDTMDTRALTTQAQLAYSLREYFPDYLVPALAVKAIYVNSDDRISDVDDDDFTMFLTLTTSMPYAF